MKFKDEDHWIRRAYRYMDYSGTGLPVFEAYSYIDNIGYPRWTPCMRRYIPKLNIGKHNTTEESIFSSRKVNT